MRWSLWSAAFQRLEFLSPHAFKSHEVSGRDTAGIPERVDRPRDTLLPQQVQSRLRRSIGLITDVIGLGTLELIIRMEARDLNLSLELQHPQQFIGHV